MSKLTAAYVAGLIDGEGSISITRNKKKGCVRGITHTCRIRVGMSDSAKDLVYWLKNSFGGCVSYRDREKDGNAQDSHTWCISKCKTIKPFIDKIYPYLKLKRPQAEVLMRFLKTYTPLNGDSYVLIKRPFGHGTGVHAELKEEIFQLRDKMFLELKRLNRRGRIVQLERLSGMTPRGCDSPTL